MEYSENHARWIHGINSLEGVVREVEFDADVADPIPILIAHAIIESETDKSVDILKRDPDQQERDDKNKGAKTRQSLQRRKIEPAQFQTIRKYEEKGDGYKTIVLADAENEEEGEKVLRRMNDWEKNDCLRILTTHQSVFDGKFNETMYASDESFYYVLPLGFYHEAPCFILSQWTVSGNGTKKEPFHYVEAQIDMCSREDNSFEVINTTFYTFKGQFKSIDDLHLRVLNPKEERIPIDLHRVTDNKN